MIWYSFSVLDLIRIPVNLGWVAGAFLGVRKILTPNQ